MLDDNQNADFVIILSSDVIAQIVEEFFNKKVYKQPVEVVDTKATEAGYMFSLTFIQQSKKDDKILTSNGILKRSEIDNMPLVPGKRNSKGQFMKDKI